MTVTFTPLQSWNATDLKIAPNPGTNTGYQVSHPHPSAADVQRLSLDECISALANVQDCRNNIQGWIANVSPVYSANGTGVDMIGYNGKYIERPQDQALKISAESDSEIMGMLSERIILLQLLEKTAPSSESDKAKMVYSSSRKSESVFSTCFRFFSCGWVADAAFRE